MRDEAEQALSAGWTGDFRPADALSSRLAGGRTVEAAGWGAALRAQRWLAEPSRGAPPDFATIEKLAGAAPGVRAAAAAACVHAERAAVLFFDAEALARWCALHEKLVDARGTIWLIASQAWMALLREDRRALDARLKTLAHEAAAAQCAPLVIEAAALRALGALLAGDLDEGIASARRAARMGQAEGLPQPQYLAHLVLARARRLSGRAHLATRILAALARVAPRPWLGAIHWEMLLAEGARAGTTEALAPADVPSAGLVDRAGRASGSLRAMLIAAAHGDRAAFAGTAAAARQAASSFPALAREIEPIVTACDPFDDLRGADPAFVSFARGVVHEAPPALAGLSAADPDATLAWVVAWPDRPARRALAIGVALAGAVHDATENRKRKPGRAEATIAALALAGPTGLAKSELFAQVYGFAYAPHLHQGVLDVLLHRVRTHLGAIATMARELDRVVLTVHTPLAVPDPRSTGPLDDRVLRLIAKRGAGTAKDAAHTLGIPLRTAQAALQQLVQQGACTLAREGRQIEYRVEDTTFNEPTQH